MNYIDKIIEVAKKCQEEGIEIKEELDVSRLNEIEK